MGSIIQTQDLHFSYTTAEGVSPVVLDGVNLEIEEGSFVAVLGHNGSGKSTLAKHMNAILLPSGGKVFVSGMDTADDNLLLDIRRTVGMVFQNPDNQIVANVVEEDVAFAPENLGIPPAEIRRRVDDALKAVGMYEFREHAPHLLSGGQKQRVAIAGVIAMRPRCIVLDEPTAMLDPVGRKEVMDTVKQLNRRAGVTVVLITHHMDEAAQADRPAAMWWRTAHPKRSLPTWRALRPWGSPSPRRWSCAMNSGRRGWRCPWTPSPTKSVPRRYIAFWRRKERIPHAERPKLSPADRNLYYP